MYNSKINVSDYLEFNMAYNKAMNLLNDKKQQTIGLYILVSIYTGLRTSDMQNLEWDDICSDSLRIREIKTGKVRDIKINNIVSDVSKKLRNGRNGKVFISQKGSVYTTQALNRILKKVFYKESKKGNISTHSLRKTFGRRVYDMNNQSDHALLLLSEAFSHSNTQITRIYLGLRKEEIESIYINL